MLSKMGKMGKILTIIKRIAGKKNRWKNAIDWSLIRETFLGSWYL